MAALMHVLLSAVDPTYVALLTQKHGCDIIGQPFHTNVSNGA
jgi:hypothetical protein